MKNNTQPILYLFLLLGLFITLNNCGSKPKEKPKVFKIDPYSAPIYSAAEEAPAKDFDITLIDGTNFKLSNQIGSVVLINIWATWCGPCLDETPDLVELFDDYKAQGFTILGVSTDVQGESVVKPFINRFDIPYPMYIDKQDIIMNKYGPTMGIPTSYIVDSKGILRYFAVGALTRKELEPRIKELISEI